MVTKIDGQLEIHHERGVIYFHSAKTGWTVLRISCLPSIPDVAERQLDMTHMVGTDWGPITPAEEEHRGHGIAHEKRFMSRLEKAEPAG